MEVAVEKKVIINCAVTGAIHVPSMSPYLPITPEQIARGAIDAAAAGAATVHLHARNPKTGERVKIKPKKLPFFKVGKDLKDRVDR